MTGTPVPDLPGLPGADVPRDLSQPEATRGHVDGGSPAGLRQLDVANHRRRVAGAGGGPSYGTTAAQRVAGKQPA